MIIDYMKAYLVGDKMPDLFAGMVHNFLVAFGVIVGASVFAGVGAVIINRPPLRTMLEIARSLKIWAMAVALGGTFSSYAAIEKGIFAGEFRSTVKQAIYVLTALSGANFGYMVIRLIQRCGELWGN